MVTELPSFPEFQTLLQKSFQANRLECFLTDSIVPAFYSFTKLLLEENAHTNLTAIRDLPGIVSKHYADCLLAVSEFPTNATVLDIGCGGGFPTIPLAIARPDLQITAVDSTQKKVTFVQKAADFLELTNVKTVCSRVEDLSHLKGCFDVVTSRAVARLNILAELALPMVKIGGQFIAMKGVQGIEELKEAEKGISTLGGILSKCLDVSLNAESQERRTIIAVQKQSASPAQYPRPYAQILKKTL